MKNALTYRGYAAKVEFDPEDHIFFGRLVGIRDIVTFHGDTVTELEASFQEAVEHYLETCAKLGDEPNKPFSGTLTLRLSPEIHAEIATAATISGKSINRWVADTLDKAVHANG